MVLLREEAAVPAARIEQELRTRYPDLNAASPADDRGTASLQLRDGKLIVALLPVPIPWSDLEGPCAASLLWKDAAEEVRSHRAHLLVTVLSELNEVERSILLTQTTLAVLAASDAAIGVYWGSAALLVPKEFFLEYAGKVLPLGHLELEARDWPEKPSELRDRFRELAHYLVQHGPVIRDRDTIGQDASEKIRAVYAPSTLGQNTRVMQLRYESPPAKPWWKIW
jgi:hypothetical protein